MSPWRYLGDDLDSFGIGRSSDSRFAEPLLIELDVTNEELANCANVTPYTTSRKWQRSGAIRKHRGKIIIRSPERFFLRVV